MKPKPDMNAQLARLASQRAPADRAAMLEEVLGYAETDLLCYSAPSSALRARQNTHFDPVLDAINQAYGIAFEVTGEIVPITQPEASLTRLRGLFEGANDRELAALFVLTPLLGSALLTLSVWKQLIPLGKALICCRVDEDFQAEQWAEDPAEKSRWETKRQEIEQCVFFLDSQPIDKK